MDKNSDSIDVTKRKFFVAMGSGALMLASAGSLVFTGDFLHPNVLFEPPSRFLVGKPEQYQTDSVVYIAESQVLVFREAQGAFYALSAVCTHLGCIVNWKSADKIIACPCHGSKFNKKGEVTGGPAPKPLIHLEMSLTSDGYLMVDKSKNIGVSEILKV